MINLRLPATGLAILISVMTIAQQKNEIELDPVTITATVTPVSASKTGRNIIIIKGERFNQLPVNSIDELLRYLPGLEVQARGPMGSQSDLLIRGGTFQQVLVIMDGIRLNDPLTGHFNSYIPIAVAEIDRIEILKGASSAIYGTEAVGGVIHIISKTFAAKPDQQKKQLQAKIGGGQYDLFTANAGGFYQKNKTAVSLGVISNNASGQQQRGTTGFFHNTSISGSVKQWLNKNWSLALRSAYDNRDFAAQNFYTSFVSDTAQEKVSSWWNHLRLNYEKNNQRFSLDLGYKKTSDTYFFRKAATPNENKSSIFQALAVYDNRLSENTVLTGGVQFQEKAIRSNDRGDHQVSYVGAFVILNQKLFDALQINPAIRVDWNERSGGEFIPQLNLSYRIQRLSLRGSIGKTTRDADFTERYNNFNKRGLTSGSIGNPDLESERSVSYEAGADYLLSNSFKISATYFRKDYSKLIDFVVTPYADMPRKDNLAPGGIYLLARNIADVKTDGFETDLQFSKSFGNKQSVFSTLGLVWLNSESNGGTPSLYISSHADFQANFNVLYSYDFLSLSVNGIYKRRPAQTGNAALVALSRDYFVMNLRADAMIWKNKLGIYVQSDNIFDRKYADRFGVPMPGSWWMGGFKLSL